METKKNFVMPEIDIVHFDEHDVITASITGSGEFTVINGVYDLGGWKDF